jgi:hypothetical protein
VRAFRDDDGTSRARRPVARRGLPPPACGEKPQAWLRPATAGLNPVTSIRLPKWQTRHSRPWQASWTVRAEPNQGCTGVEPHRGTPFATEPFRGVVASAEPSRGADFWRMCRALQGCTRRRKERGRRGERVGEERQGEREPSQAPRHHTAT